MGKYYAVKSGRVPGIYDIWDDCREQVEGYRGDQHKSFTTLAEAQQYMGYRASYYQSDSKTGKSEATSSNAKQIYNNGKATSVRSYVSHEDDEEYYVAYCPSVQLVEEPPRSMHGMNSGDKRMPLRAGERSSTSSHGKQIYNPGRAVSGGSPVADKDYYVAHCPSVQIVDDDKYYVAHCPSVEIVDDDEHYVASCPSVQIVDDDDEYYVVSCPSVEVVDEYPCTYNGNPARLRTPLRTGERSDTYSQEKQINDLGRRFSNSLSVNGDDCYVANCPSVRLGNEPLKRMCEILEKTQVPIL